MNKFNQTKPLQWFGKPCLVLSWVWKSLQCVSISHFETLLSLQMYLYRFYHNNIQGVPKKRTFRIIILQADTSERSPEAAWSLQARLVGLDGL